MKVEFPPRGFRMILGRETGQGRSVDGARLTFEAVANQFEVKEFLRSKRWTERRAGWTHNLSKSYPLKLPSTLTSLQRSRAGRASYGDAAFTDAHGPPPELRAGQQLYLFTLAEKRFKDRKPFPIICERVALVDAKGEPLGGAERPPAREWPTEAYQEFGLRFAIAVLMDDLQAASGMLSTPCRKALGKAGLRKVLKQWFGFAVRFEHWKQATEAPEYAGFCKQVGAWDPDKTAAWLPAFVSASVDDDDVLWEQLQNSPLPNHLLRDAIRASVTIETPFSREPIFRFYVVDEGGELRVDDVRMD